MLIKLDALVITLLSIVLAVILLMLTLYVMRPYLLANFGLHIDTNIVSQHGLLWLVGIIMLALIVAAIPALSFYRQGKRLSD